MFHGTNLAGEPVAVKIFHTSNAVFKNLIQYIEGDPSDGESTEETPPVVEKVIEDEPEDDDDDDDDIDALFG